MIDVSPDLLSFLKTEYDACIDTTLEQDRENAIDRYNGEPYGDEQAGASQVVARDTAETVNYMVISVLRTIVSSGIFFEFVHKMTDLAHEATQTIMHLFMNEQDGEGILHDWLKAGLLEKTAVAMTYPEPQPKKRVESIIPAPMLEQGKYIEAEEAGFAPDGTPLFRVVSMQEQPPKFCDAAVPNEEFYCSTDARNLDEAAIKGRRVRKTLSELVEMGHAKEDVETLSSDYIGSSVSNARDEDRYVANGQRQGMARSIWWHEEWVRFDLNGDGVAELLYVQRTSDYKVFSIEEMDADGWHPFEEWCPFPMPHRRVGQSLADNVMDLERIKSVVMRQTLDGIYLSNNPSTYLHEDSMGETTLEDLLTTRAGRVVRWRGAVPPQERQGAFDPSVGFNAIEFIDRMRETRTGITRLNMGLDEDTLNQTAKGQAQLIARGEQVEEYVARNFAKAVARLITKKVRLLQRAGRPVSVPIDGVYREVDPRQWPDDMIARPKVGLGTANKDQKLLFRRELMGMQAQAMQAGLGIIDEQRLYNGLKGFITDAQLGDVNEYFVEPAKDEQGNPIPKEPAPDPAMMEMQANIQFKQQELQIKQTEMGAKLQLQQAEAEARLEALRQQGVVKSQIDMQKIIMDSQMAQARAGAEAQLAERKLQIDAMLEAMKIRQDGQRKAVETDAKVSKFRDGGSLAA